MTSRRIAFLALPALLLLGACDMVVLSPSGYVADRQADILVTSTLLMLVIIIPVMVLTVFFAWRYNVKRKGNYDPDWHHSTSLELVIWAAPLLIVICLGAMTWVSTHLLDPFRPLENIGERRPVPRGVEPLDIQVVALDWKWMFIYPEYGIATINEVAAPIDRPISFHLTSTTVMNAFYVPALAGMIYAMPGMESQVHAVMNVPGEYEGFSANFSGAGFSGMRFRFHGFDQAGFTQWVGKVRSRQDSLDRPGFLEIAKPTERAPVQYFGSVDPDLFRRVVNRCVEENRMCIDEMMTIDSHGGSGHAGTLNIVPMEGKQASATGHAPFYVASFCTPAQSIEEYGPDTVVLLSPPPALRGTSDETL